MLESTSRNSSQARVTRMGEGQGSPVKADPPKDIPGPKRGGEHGHSGYEEAQHAAPKSASFVVAQELRASTARSVGITTRGSDDPPPPPPPPPEDITGTTRG